MERAADWSDGSDYCRAHLKVIWAMAVKGYLRLAADQRRLLGFGFAMTFASSIGQTFFIGAFGPSIQQEFSLSHAEWGGIYMA